ncbi:MAG: hypothetical protein AB7V77_02555 [Candidatus Woesearchaeota archaeon]
MKKLENWFNKKIKKVTFWNFALIKTCLIIFGIIIGAYISNFVKTFIWYWIAVFAILYIWIIIRFFKK